jgi:Superfamily II DNA/RNA helicases, SNF2 family
MELVQEAIDGGHSILLFSQFTSMLDILQKKLKSGSIPFYRIDGATSKEKRQEYVDRFQCDDTPVFLISLKAGGLGLNLTKADTIIIYDPWWNVAQEEQAIDRAYRMGQKRNVQVYRLICEQSIEEKIQLIQEKKQHLIEGVLSEGEFQPALDESDWMSLFS